MTPNGYRFVSYDYRKLDRFNDPEFWADSTFRSKSGFLRNFAETLNTKVVSNELIFHLVTHTSYSDARFECYRILNSGQGAENFLDRLDILTNDQVLKAEDP
jgi:hypothetical protein